MRKQSVLPKQSLHLAWQVIHLGLPIAGVLLVAALCLFFNAEMAALLGLEVLAASAITFIIQTAFKKFGRSILRSMSAFINQALGAKDDEAVGAYFQQAELLSVFIALPIMFIYWQIGPILHFMGQPPIIIPMVESYFHVAFFSVIPYLWLVCNQYVGQSLGCHKFILCSTLLSAVVLLLSAYVFVFGKWGVSAQGFAGLAYAMIIQDTFEWLLTCGYFYFNGQLKRFALFDFQRKQDWSKLKGLICVGWPIGLQVTIEKIALIGLVTFAGWISLSSLAACQVIDQYYALFLVPIWGLSQAAGLLVGQNYGQLRFEVVKKIGKVAVFIALSVLIMLGVLLLSAPNYLASIFLDLKDPSEAITLAIVLKLFVLLILLLLIGGLGNIFMNLLRALFDTRYSLWVNMLSVLGIGLPLGYVLAFPFHLDLMGLYVGYTVGICLNSILYT